MSLSKTIIIQSHKPNPGVFVDIAVKSVRDWAAHFCHAYECIDDALFDLVPDWCVDAAQGRMQMVADIGRLIWIQNLLDDGMVACGLVGRRRLYFSPDGHEY